MSFSSEADKSTAKNIIPLSVPELRDKEWPYLKECLDTGWVSSVGPFVDRFEQELAAYLGVKAAVATANGTAALHIALLVAGVRPDDEVLVSTLSFIAPANAIRYVGAWPVFIDAEPDYWQMCPQKVAEFLEHRCQRVDGEVRNRTTGRRVSAILPVHILGHPVDMDPIQDLARKYNLVVIEDAAEALGTRYKGRRAGCLGHIGCLSFNGNKIMTTGGGGMILTDNEAWAARAKYLTTQAKDDPLEFVHNAVGYNYRLTNIQAALGCAQLESLEEFIAVKRHISEVYSRALRDISGLTPMSQASWAFSTFWLYTVLVDESVYGMTSRELLKRLHAEGIQTRPLWHPLHLNPAHAGSQTMENGVAIALNRDALSLPCSVGLTEAAQEFVIHCIKDHAKPLS